MYSKNNILEWVIISQQALTDCTQHFYYMYIGLYLQLKYKMPYKKFECVFIHQLNFNTGHKIFIVYIEKV